jgi:hypothetical protein
MSQIIAEFGLPPTFPRALVPSEFRLFVQTWEGGNFKDAIADATRAGFGPIIEPLPHIQCPQAGQVLGFGLTIAGLCVPFMVRVVGAES